MRATASHSSIRSAIVIAVTALTVCALLVLNTGVAQATDEHFARPTTPTQSDVVPVPPVPPAPPTPPAPTPERTGLVDVTRSQTPAYAFDGTEIVVPVGSSLQDAVDAHPDGTHFRIASGVHRLQGVTPRDGNTFTGEPGAVLSGATVLDPADFHRDGGVWIIGGQTAESFTTGETEPGFERHAAMNDLFLGDIRANHVNSRTAVTSPGTWFFDYDRDEVVLFDDPSAVGGIELSVVESAFRSGARDVTIQHLTITRYASPSQHGAIHAAEGLDWEVGYTTVTAAHGTGIRIGPGLHLHHSRITDSGQLGVGGTDNHNGVQSPVLVEHNEIQGNRTLRYNWGWEGGATKFALTTGLVFENNWVHGNLGPGVWFDVDNLDAVVRSNLIEHNDQSGVFYEISFGARIHDNVIRHNGATAVGDLGAGVHVSSSRDVEIYQNAIYGNRSAVMVSQEDRGSGHLGVREVVGLTVKFNDIAPGGVPTGIRVNHGDPTYYYTQANNRFEANTYRMDAGQSAFWAGAHLDLSGWQERGHDLAAVTGPAGTIPELPVPAAGYQAHPAGPAS